MNIILREERLVYTLHYYKLENIPDNTIHVKELQANGKFVVW